MPARSLYLDRCGHEGAGRFVASLLALVIWTSLLTLTVFAGVLQSRRQPPNASSASPDR